MSSRMHRAAVLAFAFASMTTAACGGAPSRGEAGDTEGDVAPPPVPVPDAGTPPKPVTPATDGGASNDAAPEPALALEGPLASVTDAAGILHLFYTTADKVLHTRAQTAASASAPWGADQLVATPTTKATAIGAALDGDGNVVLAYADASEVLRFVKLASGAAAFTAPALVATSSTLASHVAVAANADGHLEIVYLDPSNLLFHTWQQGAGGSWVAPAPFIQAGNAALQIAIGTNSDGRLDVFYVGTDNQLYHDPQTVPSGGWDGEHLLGGSGELVSAVAVGSSGNQLTVLYARQSNGAVYSMQQQSSASLYGWTPENALGTGYGPAVATQMLPVAAADGCLGVVYAGSSGVLYQQEQQCTTDGKWSDSQTPFASSDDVALSLAVGAASDGTEQVFFVSGGSSHFLFHAAMTSGGWGAPEPM